MPLRAVLLQAKASALAALREAKRAPRAPPAFEPANSFAGRRDGCVFKSGDSGLGYYADASQQQAAAPAAAVAASTEPIAPIEASSMYFQVGSDRLSLRFHRPFRLFASLLLLCPGFRVSHFDFAFLHWTSLFHNCFV